jgi:hypothetical protein
MFVIVSDFNEYCVLAAAPKWRMEGKVATHYNIAKIQKNQ